MCAVVQSSNHHLQNMLQRAVQGVQWTYSLFWQLCPQQGILVWGDGYYNGAIKTRKTIQPMEVSAEEASLQRSQQLRELYDSLSAGETNQPTRRPSAALSPEDLTESEWFYLMCVSFSFAPGIGLPGRAYAKRQYVWLTGANEVDSKVFTRAILAKSARVQTVVCIPLLDGVVELGTTERVEEEAGFIQHVKNYFLEHEKPAYNHPKPALSEHSTSNPAAAHTCNFQYSSSHGGGAPTYQIEEEGEEDEEEYEDDDEEDEDEEEEEEEGDSESEVNEKNIRSRLGQNPNSQQCQTEPSELMQLDMSEDIRIGSPDENDGSNNLDSNDYHHRLIHQTRTHHDLFRSETVNRWPAAAMGDPPHINTTTTTLQPPPPTSSEVPAMEELTEEDTHYSQTVSTILQNQSSRSSDTSSSIPYFSCSSYSSFSNWSSDHHHLGTTSSSSQWLLKYILFTVPFLHSKYRSDHENSSPKSRDTASADVGSRIFRRGTAASQEDLSANHVLAERRRREKLNERFVILRSLVPFVTKMDKASILGDTIEYVKQLRKRIQDLESRQSDADRRSRSSSGEGRNNAMSTATNNYNQIRKMRILEENIGGGSQGKAVAVGADGEVEVEDVEVEVEVSIIESDALIEVQCRNREGLLLDIMQMLRELRVEITAVQSSVNNGIFAAELRAKVKDNVNGKRATITEVKRALHHIIRHYSGLL